MNNMHRAWTKQDLRAAVAGLRGDAKFNAPLKDYTSFRIGGPADVLVMPADAEDVCLLVRQARTHNSPREISLPGLTSSKLRLAWAP